MSKELTTEEQYSMSFSDLENLADALANKALFLKNAQKDIEDPERWKRICLELYHIGEVMAKRELQENN